MRICILSRDNSPLGFMDNDSPDALHFYDDKLHVYLEGTAHTFEFTASAKHEDSYLLEVGNKCAFIYKGRAYYMTLMTVEQTETEINAEAWSTSLELLNEQAIAYTAPKAMSFEEYLKAFGFERKMLTIGINEVSDKRITNEWTGESDTILKRLFSLANVFDAELEFLPVLNADYSLNTIKMNLWRAHSDSCQGVGENRQDTSFRYGINVQGITKKEDISDLYTCIRATGKDDLNIQSLGYKEVLDANGNIEYVHYANSGEIYAPQARDRFPSNIVENGDKYVCYQWSTEYTDVNTLYANALAKLKEICVPNTTYEIKGYIDVNIGDTVTVVDEGFNPPLYLSTRVTEQEICLTDSSKNSTVFDNTTELESQIDDSLSKLQEELRKVQATAKSAQSVAVTAQSVADTAKTTAESAKSVANDAKNVADTVTEDVVSLQSLTEEIKTTAETANTAADTAKTTAESAESTANDAKTTAETASSTATEAQTIANTAKETADTASTNASTALSKAETAQASIKATQNYFFHDAEGAHVTTTEGDSTTGKNVLIDADSVDIRDGTTTLASFSASEISMKSDSEKNKIKMGGLEIWTQQTDAGTTGYLYAEDNIALVAGLSSGSGLRGLRLSAVGEVGISTNTDSVNISAESGEVALTGNSITANAKEILTEEYRPAIIEDISVTGSGYSFLWISAKEGYFLAAAYCIRTDDSYRVNGVNYNSSSNLYTVLIGQNVSTSTTLTFKCLWVKV